MFVNVSIIQMHQIIHTFMVRTDVSGHNGLFSAFSSMSLSCVSTCGPVISRLLLDVSVLCVHMWTGHLSTSPRCLCPACPHVDRSSLDFSSMSLSCVSTCGPVISRLLLDVSVLRVHMWTGHLSTSPRCLCPACPHVDRSSLDFSSMSLSCVSTCGPVISRLLLDVSVLRVHMWTGHLSTSPRCLCPACPHVDRSSLDFSSISLSCVSTCGPVISRLLLDVSVLRVHMWTGHLSTSPRCLCPACPHVDRSSLDFSSMSLSCVSTCGPVISRSQTAVWQLDVNHSWSDILNTPAVAAPQKVLDRSWRSDIVSGCTIILTYDCLFLLSILKLYIKKNVQKYVWVGGAGERGSVWLAVAGVKMFVIGYLCLHYVDITKL